MREGIGSAFVYSIVITIVGIILLLIVGSIGYSKAFKVNSRIIEIIESNNGFTTGQTNSAEAEIGTALSEIGYRVSSGNRKCPTKYGEALSSAYYNYDYCVYKHDSYRGVYYTVLTYMYFDFPIIGDLIKIEFKNQTKTLNLFGGD